MIEAEEVSGFAALRSVSSYFAAFAPAPEWDELVCWPPDVFALANLVLDHTECYRFVVAPPPGRRWPPFPEWSEEVRAAAAGWSAAAGEASGLERPALVTQLWETVTRGRDIPVSQVRSGAAWDLTSALLTLHAIADEACASIAVAQDSAPSDSFEHLAWQLLQERGSLSRLSPSRVRIVPKTHFSVRGITIRSLSRHLALCYESVHVCWRSAGPRAARQHDYNIVLLPWPLSVRASDFRPVAVRTVENMDSALFGFFEFAPEAPFEREKAASVLDAAVDSAGHVDAVILPEAAVTADALPELERMLDEHGASFFVAGVREPPADTEFGRNYLHFAVRTSSGWARYEQDKHHRWCLDEPQILQYHLARALQPKKHWWEAIDIRERALHIIDVGEGVTTTPMICEDLARLDEVADLVRRIGPTLVVAVLLDGPQLAGRWSCRYASILADDPGSTVLTLTSHGMAIRSRPPGHPRSHVIAHWNCPGEGIREIELARGAAGVLVRASLETTTAWTADGRAHSLPRLRLRAVEQLRSPSNEHRRRLAAPRVA